MQITFMLVLSVIAKLVLISVPQTLANIIFIYAFNEKKIGGKNFWIAVTVSLAAIFVIRLLPVCFGIPTLLCMAFLIILGVYFLKLSVYRTTIGVLVITVAFALLESFTFTVMTSIFGEDGFIKIMDNDFTRSLVGFPSSILLLVITLIIYLLLTSHEKCIGGSQSQLPD